MIKHIINQTLSGKTINRMLMNAELGHININGKVLDLGAGNIRSSYINFLKITEPLNITSIDISPDRKPDIIANLEKSLPILDSTYDYVLCFNLLEHIYNHKTFLSEIFRVLKPGGRLIGYVPFLVKYHPDPNDYFRYTTQGLKELFKEAGFQNSEVRFIGHGAFTASWSQIEYIMPRVVRWIITLIVFMSDNFILKIKPVFRKKYALGYLFEVYKQ